MKNLRQYTILGIVLLSSILIMTSCNNNKMSAPKAEKIRKELTKHEDTRIDNYYWLNERENPEVIKYLEAENKYTENMLGHTKHFQEKLYSEIVSRIKKDDQSVPYKFNGYYYITRFENENEYPIYSRKKESLTAKEEIMLNVNKLAKGHDYFHVTGVKVSPDNKLLAYGVDTVSRRKYNIRFKNMKNGEILKDVLPNTTGSVAWANDNKTVFYTVKDETLRPHKIYKHVLGTDPKTDELIFTEDDATYTCFVYQSKSREFILIASSSTLSDEYRFLNANNPSGNFTIIQPREKDLEYSVAHFRDKFFILTNYKAKNFRLMETPISKTKKENWKEVIPHRKDILIEDIEIFNNYLAASERKDGLNHLRIINWKTNADYYINFDEETYVAYFSVNPDFDSDVIRYGYSSLTIPHSTFDYNMISKKQTLLKQSEVVGGYNKDNYHAERLWATAQDGTKVPISIVYKKGLKKDGKNPLMLYAYGSYGYSTEPWFSSTRLSLLDRGFVYAIAHVRGGEELGRSWYEDGKLLKKKNTFTDFIDCGEHLIQQKFTDSEHLFAMGGSAGGLLMGAIINMKPEIFKGVVAAVPFVDVITTMLDENIPLTTGEYDEWGNPNKKEYYDYMLSYSPYDQVEAKDYPALLVTTGLNDSQVQYWEPAKWVAKLREMKTDDNILLLKTNMEYGHGGASGRFKIYEETALEYAFIFDQVNIKE